MALDDLEGVVVASGTWLYDGAISKRTLVTARNYDMRWATYQADGLLNEGELPAEPGPRLGPSRRGVRLCGTNRYEFRSLHAFRCLTG